MPNRNICEIMGHLGRDPETKTLDNGSQVTSFSIATSNDYKDKSGEWVKKDATWWNCQAWGGLGAEVVRNFFKGDAVMVRGKGGARSWTSKDGETKTTLEIRVNEVYKPIYERREKDAHDDERPRRKQSQSEEDWPTDIFNVGDEADIPF
jgi:single-strand DNA-binding protein